MTSGLLDESEAAAAGPAAAPPADTLAQSVALMLSLLIVQRFIGFVRSVLFCRWLDPAELGEWDLALGFFTLAPPLIVCGVSGSLGRYVEHFRQQGMLRGFVRAAMRFVGCATAVCCLLFWIMPDWVMWLVLGRTGSLPLAAALTGGLVLVIVFNGVNELLGGLRKYRYTALMQFLQGVTFALLGCVLIIGWQSTALAVVLAYGAACLPAILFGVWKLIRLWPALPGTAAAMSQSAMFRRIGSFALWLWIANVLTNLFSYIDRYVILHHCGLDQDAALTLVGNYHAARVLPLVMTSLAMAAAGATLPHLSHDWEIGRRQTVAEQSSLMTRLVSVGLTWIGAVVLIAAPLLFDVALRGKFDGGRDVLQWTLLTGVWAGMHYTLFNYLWCAERSRLVTLSILVGLLLNIGLNFILIPRFGLLGAAWGTGWANLTVVLLAAGLARPLGLKLDLRLCLSILLPLLLCLGVSGAWAGFVVIAWLVCGTQRLLSEEEKRTLAQTARQSWSRFRKSPAGRIFHRTQVA